MARVPNQWIDPVSGDTYSWPVNHHEEQPMAKSRQMGDGAQTSDLGLIPQQGPAIPLLKVLKGRFFDDAQNFANLAYWNLCEGQTIYFKEFNGDQYEVIIVDYDPNKVAVARNPRFPNQRYIWEYTITMRIVRVISGPFLGVAP